MLKHELLEVVRCCGCGWGARRRQIGKAFVGGWVSRKERGRGEGGRNIKKKGEEGEETWIYILHAHLHLH